MFTAGAAIMWPRAALLVVNTFVNWRNVSLLLLCVASLLFPLPAMPPASADARDFCNDPQADPDARIPACTQLLEHPGEAINRAEVYNHRGAAKMHKGSGYLNDAIADFTSALNENPRFVDAFKNRGLARKMQGDYNGEINDFNQAIRLNGNSPDLYNLRGSALLDTQAYNPAIADFTKAIALDPNYAKAYVNRGQTLVFTRQLGRAIADFGVAISLAPKDPKGYLNRAMARMDKGEFNGAIDDYNEAIRLDQNNSGHYTRRGEAWRLLGDFQQAFKDHNKAIALDPNDKEAYNNRALTFKGQGKLDEATNDCDQAILLDPAYEFAYATRGMIRRLKGDLWGSLTDLNKAVELNPRSPVALTFRGDTLRESDNINGALEDFNKAILIVPDFVAAYTGRGLTYEKKGDAAKAKADFEKALSLSADVDAGLARPAQALAGERRATIAVAEAARAIDKGDFKVAIAAYDEAIRLDPKNPGPYTKRGEAWRLQGNLERSLADHNKALELNPNDAEAYNYRALTFKDQGKLNEAIANCDQAILLDPAYDLAYANRGMIRRQKADAKGSLADLNKAVELNPSSPIPLTFRGDTLRELGDYDGAINDFNEAIRLASNFVAAYTSRGLTYEKNSDLAKAKTDYQKALSLSADFAAGLARPAQALARDRLAALTQEKTPPLPKPEQEKSIPSDIQQALYHRGHALLIGVSEYKAGWPRLSNVKNDLQDLKAGLDDYFESVVIVQNPTVSELRGRMSEFLLDQWNDPNERLFIYYAGHGFTAFNQTSQDNDGYITGSDTPSKAVAKAVSFFEVDSWSRQTSARHVLMVFDSCFSGSLFQTMGPEPEPSPNDLDNVRTLLRRPMRYYITAGRQNEEVAADSTFAKLLLRGLRGGADKYHQGIISAEELGNYLYHEVPNYSPRPQTPQYKSIGNATLSEGQFFFLTGPAAGDVTSTVPPSRVAPGTKANGPDTLSNKSGIKKQKLSH
jgi:tetratricopeptide (TPR) repeat protein